jgi:hypothetical protein
VLGIHGRGVFVDDTGNIVDNDRKLDTSALTKAAENAPSSPGFHLLSSLRICQVSRLFLSWTAKMDVVGH